MYSKQVTLFGHKVNLCCRRAPDFLKSQRLYRKLVQTAAEVRILESELKKKENPTADEVESLYQLVDDLELLQFNYQLVVLSDSLKAGRDWRIWRWRKFEQSYLKNNLSMKELTDLSEQVAELEGNKKVKEPPSDYIPLDPEKVKAFVSKNTGIPYHEVENRNVVQYFDAIKFAGEQLKLQVEGGKINLTVENPYAQFFAKFHEAQRKGWLGKGGNEKMKQDLAQA